MDKLVDRLKLNINNVDVCKDIIIEHIYTGGKSSDLFKVISGQDYQLLALYLENTKANMLKRVSDDYCSDNSFMEDMIEYLLGGSDKSYALLSLIDLYSVAPNRARRIIEYCDVPNKIIFKDIFNGVLDWKDFKEMNGLTDEVSGAVKYALDKGITPFTPDMEAVDF